MAKKSLIDNVILYDDVTSGICCPNCGESALHHISVTMYNRLKEDGESTYCHAEIVSQQGYGDTGTTALVTQHTSNNSNNPSLRRSGLRIALECEICETLSDFCLAQHKGQTHIWMEILEGKFYGH